ncbi:MAG TPA: copper resistance protein NlpE [Flavobacterium sp.]|nr:copper resistance protein NlpE [Flavobacterium sp.]
MKTNLLLLSAVAAFTLVSCKNKNQNTEGVTTTETVEVIDGHTSENALDWAGVYEGTLPCADCEGIETTIILNQDKSFTITEEYLKEPNLVIESKGTFSWDKAGQVVILEAEDDLKRNYKVVEHAIIHLDSNAKEIKGELAEHYRLAKK